MQCSQRVSRISASATGAVFERAAELRARGETLADFGAGEPDFPTPEHIKRAAVRALEQNFTRYTSTGGTHELKKAVVSRHAQDFGSNYAVEECLITAGGKQAIFEAMAATLDDGDEVVLPTPYWPSFLDIIRYAGGRAILLAADEAEGFALHADAVEELITPRTKMIVVNSPHNPTGSVVERGEMERLLQVAARHNVLLLSDECYCYFRYDDLPFSLGSSREREHLVLAGSMSKTYAMTGWRVGYALGSARLLGNMLKLQSHSTSNPNSIAQKAAVAALTGPQDVVETMRAEYRRRRERVLAGLGAIPGIGYSAPQGAFYVYPNVSTYLGRDGLADAGALACRLLVEARVVVVPGTAFGSSRHVRLAYTAPLEQIDEGLRRTAAFFRQL